MSNIEITLLLIFGHAALFLPLLFSNQYKKWLFTEYALCLYLLGGIGYSVVHLVLGQELLLPVINLLIWLLVLLIGLVVLRYAKLNLSSEPDNLRFLTFYIATLVAVGLTVTAQHILVFGLGWVAIGILLNQLLLFYPDRPRARLAAHKKFLFSRISELTLFAALALLYWQHQTPYLSELLSHYAQAVELTSLDKSIAVLLAITALISCAQLPLHGWLIQVVESPTPVSALLHAGIINLGGFLLISFSPLFAKAVLAQWLVLVVAGMSCALAALIMMTRISVKVRLAWSTIAQMGLMLVECALGLYELALLHLFAHSFYKAYAFLNSGDAVNESLRRSVIAQHPIAGKAWILSVLATFSLGVGLVSFFGMPKLISPWLLIGLAIAFSLAIALSVKNRGDSIRFLIVLVLGLVVYSALSQFLIMASVVSHYPAPTGADTWVVLLLSVLTVMMLLMQHYPEHKWVRRSWVALNAGLYLDEWSTRVTLKFWPVKIPRSLHKQLDDSRSNLHAPLEVRYE